MSGIGFGFSADGPGDGGMSSANVGDMSGIGFGFSADGPGDAGVTAGVTDTYNPLTSGSAYPMPSSGPNQYTPPPAYTPQDQGQAQANANIYQPTYTDYGPGQAYAISNYGQGITSPFGAFVNPFPQGGSQGIAGLYNHPEYEDYGISGLTR
jgi:hypothetical protein